MSNKGAFLFFYHYGYHKYAIAEKLLEPQTLVGPCVKNSIKRKRLKSPRLSYGNYADDLRINAQS